MIHRGMVCGAPFPSVYDWTWGELLEYIQCHDERQKDDLRVEATMLFNTVCMLSNMFSGNSRKKVSVMDTFSFLWSKAERDKVKAERRHASLMKSKPRKEMTLDEQDKLLSEMKEKILAARNK